MRTRISTEKKKMLLTKHKQIIITSRIVTHFFYLNSSNVVKATKNIRFYSITLNNFIGIKGDMKK
jgi:hypothetical protein